VGAHGTGARLPPVEEQVVGLRLLTPGLGALNLSKENEPELFQLAKVGLGALGVVSQVRKMAVKTPHCAHVLVGNAILLHYSRLSRARIGCVGAYMLVTHMHIVWAVIEDPICSLRKVQATRAFRPCVIFTMYASQCLL
jgi:L-galactono-1,4-lactone dehydrogenase